MVWVVCFYILGIILGRWMDVPVVVVYSLLGLSLIIFLLNLKRNWLSTAALILGVLLLGFVAGENRSNVNHISEKALEQISTQNSLRIKGVIATDIQRTRRDNHLKISFTLNVESFEHADKWVDVKAKVLVNAFVDSDFSYGNRIIIEGKLSRPFSYDPTENFSYADYLENHGIFFIFYVGKDNEIAWLEEHQGNGIKEFALKTREYLKKIFYKSLSGKEASIMSAFILGDRSQIPDSIKQLFVHTGTIHILAISGFNVAIVAGLFFVLIKMFPAKRSWQIVITIILLVGYCLLTGASPSVVRATIMAVVFLMGYIFERESQTLNSLSVAALLILLINPNNLFDVGFQLSFVCVLSMIVFYPLLRTLLNQRIKIENMVFNFVIDSLLLSIAVWMGVAGLIVYYFNIVTPVTILANLFVVPISSAIVALGLGMIAAGICFPAFSPLLAHCIKVSLNLLVGLIYCLDKIPGAYFYLPRQSVTFLCIYYFLLFAFLMLLKRLTKKLPVAHFMSVI